MDGELSKFEKWFLDSQRRKGNKNPSGLIGVERAILKTYMLYYTTQQDEVT